MRKTATDAVVDVWSNDAPAIAGPREFQIIGDGEAYSMRLLDVRHNYLTSTARKQLAPMGPLLLDRPQRRVSDYDPQPRVAIDLSFDDY